MKKIISILILIFKLYSNSFSSELFGIIKDSNTNEMLICASIYIKELKIGSTSGLDGSYRIKNLHKGTYTIVCSYISYLTVEKVVSINQDNSKINLNYFLKPVVLKINEVTVSAQKTQSSEFIARKNERESANLMNIVSAKTIELSPDQDVASVVQRISGVT